MITQLSLSQNTIRNLRSINPNLSHGIEWIIRQLMTDGLPSPYVVSDRSSKQVVGVNLSPYSIGILESFASFGLNPSQSTEFLVKEYTDALKKAEPPAPKPIKEKLLKAKRESSVTYHHTMEPFVRSQQSSGPIVKKSKIRPTKR